MIRLKVLDETAQLEAVILGTAESFGGIPSEAMINDPKSLQHIKAGTFPEEAELVQELECVADVLRRYDVTIYRPEVINDYNQIFTRDIGFVIGDRLVVPFIAHGRREEVKGINYVIDQCDTRKVLRPQLHQRMEGGDVILWDGKILVGYSREQDFDEYLSARTNEAGVEFLQKTFNEWEVCPFELAKSDTDPRVNALHLDCCFQPIGRHQAILYPQGFKNQCDVDFLLQLFQKENVLIIDQEEMYHMNSNIFSVSPEVIISEQRFGRLNAELRHKGFTVEEVPFFEISKMEGLLRCATLPLRRRYA